MMNEAKAERLREVVAEVMEQGQVPGIVAAVVESNGRPHHLALGVDGRKSPVDVETLFPVASVTKLATALAVLRLVEAGALDLDAPLERSLPDAAAARPGVTLRTLLCHRSGLPADLSADLVPYGPELNWPKLARACLETPLVRTPDTFVRYSNVGYGLLAIAVERAYGQVFSAALGGLVLEPLGIEAYLGAEPPRPPANLIGDRSPEVGTPLEPYNSSFWRSLALPWAGLITTVDGAMELLAAYLGWRSRFLSEDLRIEATTNQNGELGGGPGGPLEWEHAWWGLGPEMRNAKKPHWAPAEANPVSFGHAGMSGCLAWADPVAGVAWTFLGTRTADNGWLVRWGPAIGRAALNH